MQCHGSLQFPDFRPRACSHRSLFVRWTPTRPRAKGQQPHFTQHLGHHVALWAMRQLRLPSLFEELGLSGAQRSAVLGNLVGRMAAPRPPSAPRDTDCASAAPWASCLAATARPWAGTPCSAPAIVCCATATRIETRLLQRAVTLFDRTSTCFEGAADRQPLARRGHSREKRHDCPPLMLGLVLDASGFARRSRVLAGARLETALRTLHEGLSRKGTTRRVEKVWPRIGRLQARHPSAAPHYAIDVQADDRGRNATAVAWKRQPLEGSGATHPGVHGLRTSSVGWDAGRLWRTCVTPTDLEAVFRSLKSELGPRPIHHRRPARKATRAEF